MGIWSNVRKLPKSRYPSFTDIWARYPVYRDDPCSRERVQYQCAVYLSAALARTGIIGEDGFDGRQGYGRNPTCGGVGDFRGMRFARGSRSLADFLHHRLFRPQTFAGNVQTRTSLAEKKGIIFYRHIRGFTNQGGGRGSHIDLWNGPLGGDESEDSPYKIGEYFEDAGSVHFWEFQR